MTATMLTTCTATTPTPIPASSSPTASISAQITTRQATSSLRGLARHILLSLSALLVIMTATLADEKSELKALEGNWLVVDVEIEGKKVGESFKGLELVLSGYNYFVKVNGDMDKGTFTINPNRKPKEIDISGGEGPNRGKTYLAVYELKDDTLTVCYGLDFKTRPTDFTAPEKSNRMIIVYKKKK